MTLETISKDFVDMANSRYNLNIDYERDAFINNRMYILRSVDYIYLSILKGRERGSVLYVTLFSKYQDFDHFIRHGEIGGGCEPERDIILRESLVSNNYFEVKTSYDDYEEAMGKIVDFIGLVFSN